MRYRFFSAAFTAITFLFFHSLAAQNTFPASGSVGIGTTSPLKLLHVKGAGAFGSHVTAANATRALNLADVNAVMRILRVHASNAPAVELISRMSADGPNVAYWDLYVQPSDKSFRIRDRIGSGLDRLTISNDGNVGIGTITPHYPFHVVNPASQHGIHVENAFWGNADQYGVYASSVNAPGYGYGVRGEGGYFGVYGAGQGSTYSGGSYGVYGYASGTSGAGTRYGVYGNSYGGSSAYGVYGKASNASSFNAAGYFDGAVWARTYNTISDRKFKQDIQPVEDGLEQVLKLRPATYTFKTREYKGMHLPEGRQLGLIADEVKEVYPELVQQAVHPAEYDIGDKEKIITPEVKYEGVNYQGLIPVLIASIQEQQQQIAELTKKAERLETLEKEMAELKALVRGANINIPTNTYLEQNTPNPAITSTNIRYHIPETSTSARFTLTNAKGQVVKTISFSNRGTGQISLNTSMLAAGTYSYTLYVNGLLADTKRLVIVR